jgi:two-component system, OmpR family, sensor histidine kinase BaeS
MRIRLFHKLFLIIAATALLSALAMAAVLSLTLSRGFGDYLQSRDGEQLDAFAAAAAMEISEQHLPLAAVVPGALARDAVEGGGLPPPPRDWNDTDRGPERGPEGGGPPRPPPESFSARLILLDASGRQIYGPPPPPEPDAPVMQMRPIHVDGNVVGTAALVPRGPAPFGVEARFLQSQYRAAVVLTLALLALAAMVAAWVARLGVRRFDRMALVTRAVAQGDFGARIDVLGEDELAGMGHNINAMSEGLAQLDGARRRWLAEISHELRTPLAALVGELDALKDGVRPLDQKAVRSLAEDAQRLTRIVQDLHFLAVSDLSGASCQPDDCDAVSIVRRVANRFAAPLRAMGIALRVDSESLQSLPVRWDAERIDQLLTNLLTNSERYTDAPGQVHIRLAVRGTDVCIDVEDSAPSVTPEHLGRLFEPMFRENAARSRVSDGSGLGLAVAKAIVAAHGGSISAAVSSLGGLAICIVLPAGGRNA